MLESIIQYEALIRLSCFIGIFLVMAVLERMAPRRALTQSRTVRWLNNLGLVVLNTLVLRLLFPAAAVGMALLAEERGWGLLNFYHLPQLPAVLLTILVLDFFIYLQHVMVHAVPLLWRLHRVHHADLDFDVTTGARFHPLEIVLSMLIKFAVIILLGPPVAGVILFEVILNATAMFNHSNVRLPAGLDGLLRWVLVTPDMHRVHHSVDAAETNSNFGFNLPWWDRLFGTYRAQPQAGHQGMTIGIDTFRTAGQCTHLPGMLLIPFRGKVEDYAINRRWNRPHE